MADPKVEFVAFRAGPEHDTMTLNGIKTPIVEVTGLSIKNIYNVTQGIGQLGATLRLVGRELVKFTTAFKLYTFNDWTVFNQDIKPLLEVLPTGKNKTSAAITIGHPRINSMGVRAGAVETLYAPEPDGETDGWLVKVDWLEYRVIKPVLSKLDAPKAEPPDPNADIKAKLDASRVKIGVTEGKISASQKLAASVHRRKALAP